MLNKTAFKQIGKVQNASRTTHNTLTLPWNDDGARIISAETYETYSKTMRQYRKEMEKAVEAFLADYANHVKQAKKDLGKMFREDDYPTKEFVQGKFGFDVEITPVPTARDFRAKISDKDSAAIAADIERRNRAKLDAAIKDVWERISKVTEKMIDKLDNYKPREGLKDVDGIFRDSLVENIRDLAGLMPSLNITGDPALKKIHRDILDGLCKYDAKDLRDDAKIRSQTSKKAKAIYDKVSQYLA